MNINYHAPLVAHREIFIQALPEVVWKTHTNINNWSHWQPDIDKARLKGPLAPESTFQWKAGGLSITSTIQLVEPEQQICWTGKALGTRAEHSWMIKGHNNGTIVTTEESMEGWLINILKFIMPKFLEKSLDTWLENLKSRAEDNDNRE